VDDVLERRLRLQVLSLTLVNHAQKTLDLGRVRLSFFGL